MKTLSNWKAIIASIKWTVVILLVLSGWVVAAWIKADLRPSFGQLGQKSPPMVLEPLKPGKGQEWATQDCVSVRYIQDEKSSSPSSKPKPRPSPDRSGVYAHEVSPGTQDPLRSTQQQGSPSQGTAVLPLGKFLVPSSGRDPLFAVPELDSQTGKTTLQVEPAGGFVRFGGERYAFMDLSYQRLLRSDFALSGAPALSIGLHQDLGRIGRLELMAEGWLQGSLVRTPVAESVELGVGARLRLALPF